MTKVCPSCDINKPTSDYYLRKGSPYGSCKSCCLKRQKSYYESNKYDIRVRQVARCYGIGMSSAKDLLSRKSCDICGCDASDFKLGLHVDHCHKTGKVRGVLCHACNTGIGSLKDDPKLLKKAMEYLTWHEQQ